MLSSRWAIADPEKSQSADSLDNRSLCVEKLQSSSSRKLDNLDYILIDANPERSVRNKPSNDHEQKPAYNPNFH